MAEVQPRTDWRSNRQRLVSTSPVALRRGCPSQAVGIALPVVALAGAGAYGILNLLLGSQPYFELSPIVCAWVNYQTSCGYRGFFFAQTSAVNV